MIKLNELDHTIILKSQNAKDIIDSIFTKSFNLYEYFHMEILRNKWYKNLGLSEKEFLSYSPDVCLDELHLYLEGKSNKLENIYWDKILANPFTAVKAAKLFFGYKVDVPEILLQNIAKSNPVHSRVLCFELINVFHVIPPDILLESILSEDYSHSNFINMLQGKLDNKSLEENVKNLIEIVIKRLHDIAYKDVIERQRKKLSATLENFRFKDFLLKTSNKTLSN